MALLFFDAEATGLVYRNRPSNDPSQPHIVQLAALLTDDCGKEISSMSVIVKPDGWSIPEQASNVHGITTDMADKYGIPIKDALNLFTALLNKSDEVIGHNVDFDMLVTEAEMHRAELSVEDCWPGSGYGFCTMRKSVDIRKIPHPGGWKGYKWPKLSEAYKHFFDKELEGAHDAMVDVRACAEVYFEIMKHRL